MKPLEADCQVFLDPPRAGRVHLPETLYERVAANATAHDTTISAVVRSACEHYLARDGAHQQADRLFDRIRPALKDHLDRYLNWSDTTHD